MRISLPLKIDQKSPPKKNPHNNEINQDHTTGGLQMSWLNAVFSQATQISNFLFLPEAIKAETLSLASKITFFFFCSPFAAFIIIFLSPPQLCLCVDFSTGSILFSNVEKSEETLPRPALLAGARWQIQQRVGWESASPEGAACSSFAGWPVLSLHTVLR